jgi:hypothetical protein
VPQNSIDLTLVATAAGEVGANASDPALQRIITAASKAVASYLGYPIEWLFDAAAQSVPGNGSRYLFLRAVGNLQQIFSITVGGALLAPSEYAIDDAQFARIRRVNGLWPFTGRTSGGVADDPLRAEDTGDIVVSYAAGWVTPGQVANQEADTVQLPADIEQAALEVITAMWRRRGLDQGVAARSLGDGSVTYRDADVGPLSRSTKALLAPYRRIPGAF